MVYGYARVSTPNQKIDRQIINILRHNSNAKIYQEHFTGVLVDRPIWNKLYNKVQLGDTIIFDEVSRMSRNGEEGFKLYKELFKQGVELVFLKEPHINTTSYHKAMNVAMPSIQTSDNATSKLIETILDAMNIFILSKVEEDIKRAFEDVVLEYK